MKLFPNINQTIVLTGDCSKITNLLHNNTRQKGDGIREGDRLFRGIVNGNHFKISLDVRENMNFMPLIIGRFENTSNGCLLFLNYQLYWGTIVILGFWLVITVLLAFFFYVVKREVLYGTIALAFGILNYSITMFNFNRMVNKSRGVLEQILGIENVRR